MLISKKQKGSVILSEGANTSDKEIDKFFSKSVGMVPCSKKPGIHTAIIVKDGPNDNTVNVSFLALLQKVENNFIILSALDIPSVEIPLGQSTLFVNRSDSYIAIPVNSKSSESIKNAQSWSPRFKKYD